MVNVRPTNGVSWGIKHTVDAAEASANEVTFNFQTSVNLVAIVQHGSSAGVLKAATTLTITYPAAGQITVAGTALTAGDLIFVVANRFSVES